MASKSSGGGGGRGLPGTRGLQPFGSTTTESDWRGRQLNRQGMERLILARNIREQNGARIRQLDNEIRRLRQRNATERVLNRRIAERDRLSARQTRLERTISRLMSYGEQRNYVPNSRLRGRAVFS